MSDYLLPTLLVLQSLILLVFGVRLFTDSTPEIIIHDPRPVPPKKKASLNLAEKDLYDIVNKLLEHCQATKDEEGSMLITAYGKHLYDKKIVKKK